MTVSRLRTAHAGHDAPAHRPYGNPYDLSSSMLEGYQLGQSLGYSRLAKSMYISCMLDKGYTLERGLLP